MNLEKKYKTPEGIECNILQLVKIDPEWAANIIQYYEDKLAERGDGRVELPVRRLDEGKLWSALRTLLSQGGDIQLDYTSGKYKSYEEYSIRLDSAARERVEWLKEIIKSA